VIQVGRLLLDPGWLVAMAWVLWFLAAQIWVLVQLWGCPWPCDCDQL
jgi:hypothetical protein